MGPRALIVIGAAVVAFLVLRKSAAAAEKAPSPGFVADATKGLPVTVIGCSFARAGGILVDVTTGKEISEKEAKRRGLAEGCPVPGPNIFVGATS